VKTIRFTVNRPPMGAPRMTQADKWKQRDCVVRYRAFKDAIRAACPEWPSIEASSVESLSWTAYFEPPASWSKKKRAAAIGTLHRAKPDRDNIDKAVLDALFDDDAAIADGRIQKRWAEESRIEIVILTAAEGC